MLGGGYEFERSLRAEVSGQPVAWVERVQLVRSQALAAHQAHQLAQRLAKAEAAVRALTPRGGGESGSIAMKRPCVPPWRRCWNDTT